MQAAAAPHRTGPTPPFGGYPPAPRLEAREILLAAERHSPACTPQVLGFGLRHAAHGLFMLARRIKHNESQQVERHPPTDTINKGTHLNINAHL